MRKTSKTLGIIGGAITILFNAGGLVYISLLPRIFALYTYSATSASPMFYLFARIGIIFCIIGIIGGLTGFISSFFIARSRIVCGVLMCVAAVTAFASSGGTIGGILFILAAVFALRKDPKEAQISSQDTSTR